MTGPDHYKEAQRLLDQHALPGSDVLARAQVHATLSVAAAVIAAATDPPIPDHSSWFEWTGMIG